MALRSFVSFIGRRWLPVLLITLIGAAAGVVALRRATPKYESSAQLILVTPGPRNLYDQEEGQVLSQQLIQSFTAIVANDPVLEPVIQRLGLKTSSAELKSEITVSSPLDTVLLNISVRDQSQARATLIAEAVASQFTQYVHSLQTDSQATDSPSVEARITQPASPAGQVAPKKAEYIAVGVAVGLLLGLSVAAIIDALANNPAVSVAAKENPFIEDLPADR